MKLLSFNVNGIKQSLEKGLLSFFNKHDFDIICLQEVKSKDVEVDLPGYFKYYNYAVKNGYSSTAVFSKTKPLSIKRFKDDDEGRLLIVEYDKFYVLNIYTPNSQADLKRINFRIEWESVLRNYIQTLKKDIIICGDLNVAPIDRIDVYKKMPKGTPGCSEEEREEFQKLLNIGFTDMFRHYYPDKIKYSFFSSRLKNNDLTKGWRIDFVLSTNIKLVKDVEILDTCYKLSDHRPVIFYI